MDFLSQTATADLNPSTYATRLSTATAINWSDLLLLVLILWHCKFEAAAEIGRQIVQTNNLGQ